MDKNAKLIWLNRAFNFVASAGFLSAAAGAVVDLGGYADQIRALGIDLPKKWIGILMVVGAAGHVAAKLSKTPSKAIAAAVPPAKHGTHEGDICMGCGGLAQACPGCSRAGGRCWRHVNTTVVVPPYTFRPFEPVDSTVYPFVVTPASVPTAVPMGIASGMSWAPPPAVMLDARQPYGGTTGEAS